MVILLTASWALVGAPMLCIAGALEHVCASHSDADVDLHCCAESDCSCELGDDPCKHEGDCSTDPCNQVTAARNPGQQDTELTPPERLSSSNMAAIPVLAPASIAAARQCEGPPSARLCCRSIHPSDLPLLL